MEPRIIKSAELYRTYLAEVERLVTEDPLPGTVEGDRLELLAKLVEDYERERFKFDRPDPVDAIAFRMKEQGLKQKDLAPLLGGKNRVSEVLSRKRPLTLAMVRALTDALKIPAELLIQEPEGTGYEARSELHEDEIPMSYMVKSGWFGDDDTTRLTTGAIVQRYLKPERGPPYLRRTTTFGATPRTNKQNLRMWVSKVRELAYASSATRGVCKPNTLNEGFLSYVAGLSWSERGPILARDFLAEKGIALVFLPALPHTKLDGAAMVDRDGAPIVGLTVRHDRLDNFWFTLLHELVHVWKHLPDKDTAITDESIEEGRDDDAKEVEANRLARDIFIPRAIWQRSEAFLRPSVQSIRELADTLHISPAIVAGRLRHEKTGYGAFSRLVGSRQVRILFPDVKWI